MSRAAVVAALAPVLLLLGLGPVTQASAHPAPADTRSAHGLLVYPRGWGTLHRGMTAKQAQHTGMVSTTVSGCAPGYQMVPRLLERGYVVWDAAQKPWTVHQIVVTGQRDHTKAGSHPGMTLGLLRRQHPHLSKIHGGATLDGQHQGKQDVWVAWVRNSRGTLNFQFPYGFRPKAGSRVESILVSKKPAVYYGC